MGNNATRVRSGFKVLTGAKTRPKILFAGTVRVPPISPVELQELKLASSYLDNFVRLVQTSSSRMIELCLGRIFYMYTMGEKRCPLGSSALGHKGYQYLGSSGELRKFLFFLTREHTPSNTHQSKYM